MTSVRYILIILTSVGTIGCGLEVTQDRPAYADLDPHEKRVVQIVLDELRGFNAQVETYTPYTIASVINREKINVSFKGKIFFGNLGDQVIHISPWENLSEDQRKLAAGWFSTSVAAAKPIYEKLFYRFLAISQGAKQFQYEALGVEWVFGNRSLYNVERDSLRETLSYYRHVGRQAEMWSFVTSVCKSILVQHGSSIPFSKSYLRDNVQQLANPDAPTGYMRYVCGWIAKGKVDAVDMRTELTWVPTIPSLQGKEKNPGG
ncbi:MAG: hypothetical protein CSA65_07995 [Proteobacteria bacterium]|nr:MAG: hypothetical protein CSA65_07995 [Pseudomonadota bacterium]